MCRELVCLRIWINVVQRSLFVVGRASGVNLNYVSSVDWLRAFRDNTHCSRLTRRPSKRPSCRVSTRPFRTLFRLDPLLCSLFTVIHGPLNMCVSTFSCINVFYLSKISIKTHQNPLKGRRLVRLPTHYYYPQTHCCLSTDCHKRQYEHPQPPDSCSATPFPALSRFVPKSRFSPPSPVVTSSPHHPAFPPSTSTNLFTFVVFDFLARSFKSIPFLSLFRAQSTISTDIISLVAVFLDLHLLDIGSLLLIASRLSSCLLPFQISFSTVFFHRIRRRLSPRL